MYAHHHSFSLPPFLPLHPYIFDAHCHIFLYVHKVDGSLEKLTQRKVLDVLRDSLADHPNEANRNENEVRYKLIIDPSEDDSTMRLLFMFGVLDRQKTRVFVCSDFPGDTHLQKVFIIYLIVIHACPNLPSKN